MLVINDNLQIPESELTFRYSRSSGPGGQNVNKVATKVTLLFDVSTSPSLTAEQRTLIEHRLAGRISRDGVLHVTSQRHRTRSANQRDVEGRFIALLSDALHERRPRKKSRVPAAARKRRLEDKRKRAAVKKLRSRPDDSD
jgi:ribosome-associated protein